MTEEQITRRFRDLFPDYTRGAENLSPFFDIFEAGIEIATNEFEKENKILEGCLLAEQEHTLMLEKQIQIGAEQIRALQKQNGELTDRCRELEKENAELQEELEKWKAEWQEQVQKATDEGYTRTQLQIENGKLKEQIEKMKRCEICKHYRWNHCSYEINISKDCIQNKLKHFELKESN